MADRIAGYLRDGAAEPKILVRGARPPTTMKTTFTYTVLRYVHDIATGEFVNRGVALYSPEAKYVSALCNPRQGRLNKMFLEVNGENLRSLVRYIQARFEEFALILNRALTLNNHP